MIKIPELKNLKSMNKTTENDITMIISSLGCGGAERVLKNMTDYWVQHGCSVAVITALTKENDFFQLDERISRQDLGIRKKSSSFFGSVYKILKIICRLRGAIKKANGKVIISFVTGINIWTLLVTRFSEAKVIVSERGDPRHENLDIITGYLRRILYKKAMAVVVLTDSIKQEWGDLFLDSSKVMVIPNAVAEYKYGDNVDKHNIELPGRYIVTSGRLVPVKGHEILLAAFSIIADDFPDLSLVILGDGPERKNVGKKIESYGLSGRVILPGRIHNVAPILKQAECFVLSSLREGFGNVIIEAMSCGCPPVSFCCGGPSVIIRDGVDGILVPVGDAAALAGGISELLNNPELSQKMGAIAEISVQERFSEKVIMSKWDKLLNDVSGDRC